MVLLPLSPSPACLQMFALHLRWSPKQWCGQLHKSWHSAVTSLLELLWAMANFIPLAICCILAAVKPFFPWRWYYPWLISPCSLENILLYDYNILSSPLLSCMVHFVLLTGGQKSLHHPPSTCISNRAFLLTERTLPLLYQTPSSKKNHL